MEELAVAPSPEEAHNSAVAFCPFCHISWAKENVWFQNDDFAILDTLDKKGHRERIMVMAKKHSGDIDDKVASYALGTLITIAKKVFWYAERFVVLEATYARWPNHWHRIACSPDEGKDIEQMNNTKWVIQVSVDVL